MSTDRELLELAAKAAGIELACWDEVGSQWIRVMDDPAKRGGWGSAVFDPLTDDGDALRLAAQLKIDLEWQATSGIPEPMIEAYRREEAEAVFCASNHENDYRRAIVLVAAEIGRRQEVVR